MYGSVFQEELRRVYVTQELSEGWQLRSSSDISDHAMKSRARCNLHPRNRGALDQPGRNSGKRERPRTILKANNVSPITHEGGLVSVIMSYLLNRDCQQTLPSRCAMDAGGHMRCVRDSRRILRLSSPEPQIDSRTCTHARVYVDCHLHLSRKPLNLDESSCTKERRPRANVRRPLRVVKDFGHRFQEILRHHGFDARSIRDGLRLSWPRSPRLGSCSYPIL
jgi:hypothetical protein